MVVWSVAMVDFLENSLQSCVVPATDGMTWRDALLVAFPESIDRISSLPEDINEAQSLAVSQEWLFDCNEYELGTVH